MNADINRIADDLLTLPRASRVYLGELLIESVDGFVDEDTKKAWSDEVVRRMTEVEKGDVQGVSSEDVFQQAKERIREARDLPSSGTG